MTETAVAARTAVPEGERPTSPTKRTRRIAAWWHSQHVWFRWALLLVAVRLVLRVWISSSAYFHMDDWFYLVDAGDRPFLEYVTQIYNGHLMPLGFAFVWSLQSLWPGAWAPAAALVVALDALGVVLLVALLRQAFRPTRWLLVPLGVGLFAPMWATTGVWYASALQVLPLTAAMYGSLYLLVRYFQRRSVGALLGALGVYALALAFWEKSLLITIVVAFVSVGFFADGSLVRRLRQTWIVLVSFAGLSTAYLWIYLAALAGQDPLNDSPSLTDLTDVAYSAVVEVLVPTLFGGTWNAPSGGVVAVPAPAPSWVSWLLLELAVAVVVLSVLRRPRAALWAWSMVLVYVAVDVALIALGRFDFFGALLARDPRYVEDAVPVVVIALALAFVPVVRAAGTEQQVEPVRRQLPPAGLRTPTVLILAGFVVINSCLITTAAVGRMWDESASKSFWSNFQEDAQDLGDVSIVDRQVPETVMAGLFLEKTAASYISQALPVDVRWDEPDERIYILQDDGHIDLVTLSSPVRSWPGPDGPCGYGVKLNPVEIPLALDLFEWTWVVRMTYLASGDATVDVSMGGAPVEVPVKKGLGEVWFVVQGSGSTVQVDPPSDGQGVCVASLEVGVG